MQTFHPARISLAIVSVTAIVVCVLIVVLRQRARELYRRKVAESKRERLLLASMSFSITFAIVRLLTHAIHAGRGPFHDIQVGGLHIHHLVWGIFILLAVGYGWLLPLGTSQDGEFRWAVRILSLLFGIGAALTLDEFALWLNLEDVYWERQGRKSIDAVILFGGLLSIGIWGGPFLHALVTEVYKIAGRDKR